MFLGRFQSELQELLDGSLMVFAQALRDENEWLEGQIKSDPVEEAGDFKVLEGSLEGRVSPVHSQNAQISDKNLAVDSDTDHVQMESLAGEFSQKSLKFQESPIAKLSMESTLSIPTDRQSDPLIGHVLNLPKLPRPAEMIEKTLGVSAKRSLQNDQETAGKTSVSSTASTTSLPTVPAEKRQKVSDQPVATAESTSRESRPAQRSSKVIPTVASAKLLNVLKGKEKQSSEMLSLEKSLDMVRKGLEAASQRTKIRAVSTEKDSLEGSGNFPKEAAAEKQLDGVQEIMAVTRNPVDTNNGLPEKLNQAQEEEQVMSKLPDAQMEAHVPSAIHDQQPPAVDSHAESSPDQSVDSVESVQMNDPEPTYDAQSSRLTESPKVDIPREITTDKPHDVNDKPMQVQESDINNKEKQIQDEEPIPDSETWEVETILLQASVQPRTLPVNTHSNSTAMPTPTTQLAGAEAVISPESEKAPAAASVADSEAAAVQSQKNADPLVESTSKVVNVSQAKAQPPSSKSTFAKPAATKPVVARPGITKAPLAKPVVSKPVESALGLKKKVPTTMPVDQALSDPLTAKRPLLGPSAASKPVGANPASKHIVHKFVPPAKPAQQRTIPPKSITDLSKPAHAAATKPVQGALKPVHDSLKQATLTVPPSSPAKHVFYLTRRCPL